MIRIVIPTVFLISSLFIGVEVISEASVVHAQSVLPQEEVILDIPEVTTTILPVVTNDGTYNAIHCSCIKTARAEGVLIPYGTNAWDLAPNSDIPIVGGLVLMQYKVAHVAVVVTVTELHITILEGNYTPCKRELRTLHRDHYAIRGYWTP